MPKVGTFGQRFPIPPPAKAGGFLGGYSMTHRPHHTLPLPIALFGVTAILGLFLVSGGALWLLAALVLLILAS